MKIELYLKHGRDDPDQEMDDWGFDGPRLQNVIGIHQTYNNPIRVVFATKQATDTAKRLTGWERWDDNALEIRRHDDLIVANGKYYGDWGIWVEQKRKKKQPDDRLGSINHMPDIG